MSVSTTATCDRCSTTESAPRERLPDGWANVAVNVMPMTRGMTGSTGRTLCPSCRADIEAWLAGGVA